MRRSIAVARGFKREGKRGQEEFGELLRNLSREICMALGQTLKIFACQLKDQSTL